MSTGTGLGNVTILHPSAGAGVLANGTGNVPTYPPATNGTLSPPPGSPSNITLGWGYDNNPPTDSHWLDPLSGHKHIQSWFPDPSKATASYSDNGLNNAATTWLAPWFCNGVTLPVAIRQLLSWNREKYHPFNKFADHDIDLNQFDALEFPTTRYQVPVRIDVRPRPDLMDDKSELVAVAGGGTTAGLMGWAAIPDVGVGYTFDLFNKARFYNASGTPIQTPGGASYQNSFPSMRSQWWEVAIQYAPDPYINRFGYRYCAIEIKPTTRLESLKHLPVGIVPANDQGQPDFDTVDAENGGDSNLIERIAIGFPVRDAQIEVVMRYPWVSATRLLEAGPIGNPAQLNKNGALVQAPVNNHNLSPGMLLGTVNRDSFLGFPRGRVMYTASEIEESVSPVTGQLGYKVSNHFLIHTTREWNQTRYVSPKGPAGVAQIQNDMTPAWRNGFMVLLDSAKAGNIIFKLPVNAGGLQAIYPYPYRDFQNLAYYGVEHDGKAFNTEA